MIEKMNKIFSFILLMLFIFNMSGIFIVFKIEQAFIRQEIKNKIKGGVPEDDLHLFVLSRYEYGALNWVREDIEFRYGNEMFDVVRSQFKSDSVYLYCINDKEETVLFARLDSMIFENLNAKSKNKSHPLHYAIKLFKTSFIFTNDVFDISEYLVELKQKSECYILFYTSPYLGVNYPPPNIV